MRHKNMLFDVMVMNIERQLVELAHERFGKPLEQCTDEEAFYVVMELTKRITAKRRLTIFRPSICRGGSLARTS